MVRVNIISVSSFVSSLIWRPAETSGDVPWLNSALKKQSKACSKDVCSRGQERWTQQDAVCIFMSCWIHLQSGNPFCRVSRSHTGMSAFDVFPEAHRHLLWPLTPFLHLPEAWSWQLKSCQSGLCEVHGPSGLHDYESTVAARVFIDWLTKLVGGQDTTNRQQREDRERRLDNCDPFRINVFQMLLDLHLYYIQAGDLDHMAIYQAALPRKTLPGNIIQAEMT